MKISKSVGEIIIFNIILFLLCSSFFQDFVYDNLSVFPPSSLNFEPFQLITYQFLHSNFDHLFFNLLFLFIFGSAVEQYFGRFKFWLFYLSIGVFSAMTELTLSGNSLPLIGASGSIYGVMAASAIIDNERKLKLFFPIKVNLLIYTIILFEAVNIIYPTNDFVAHFAHLGGALFAIFIVLINKLYFTK